MADERHRVTVSPSPAEQRNRSFVEIRENMRGVRRPRPKALPIGLPRATSRASQSRMGRQTGPAGAAQRMMSEPAYITNPRDVGGAGRLVGPGDRLTVAPRNAAASSTVAALPIPADRTTTVVRAPRALPVQSKWAGDAPFPGRRHVIRAGGWGRPGAPFLAQRQLSRATNGDPEVAHPGPRSAPIRAAAPSLIVASPSLGGWDQTGPLLPHPRPTAPTPAPIVATGGFSVGRWAVPAVPGGLVASALIKGKSRAGLARTTAMPYVGAFGRHEVIPVTPLPPIMSLPTTIVGAGRSRAGVSVAGPTGSASLYAARSARARQGKNLTDPVGAISVPHVEGSVQRRSVAVTGAGAFSPPPRRSVPGPRIVPGAPGAVSSPIGPQLYSGITKPATVSRSLGPVPLRRSFLIAADRPATSFAPAQTTGFPWLPRGTVQHLAPPASSEAARSPAILGPAADRGTPEGSRAVRRAPERGATLRRTARAPELGALVAMAARSEEARDAGAELRAIPSPRSALSWMFDRRPSWAREASSTKEVSPASSSGTRKSGRQRPGRQQPGIGRASGPVGPVVTPATRLRLSRSVFPLSIAVPFGPNLRRPPAVNRAPAVAGEMSTRVTTAGARARLGATRPAPMGTSSGASGFPAALAFAGSATSIARAAAPVATTGIRPFVTALVMARSALPATAGERVPVVMRWPITAREPAAAIGPAIAVEPLVSRVPLVSRAPLISGGSTGRQTAGQVGARRGTSVAAEVVPPAIAVLDVPMGARATAPAIAAGPVGAVRRRSASTVPTTVPSVFWPPTSVFPTTPLPRPTPGPLAVSGFDVATPARRTGALAPLASRVPQAKSRPSLSRAPVPGFAGSRQPAARKLVREVVPGQGPAPLSTVGPAPGRMFGQALVSRASGRRAVPTQVAPNPLQHRWVARTALPLLATNALGRSYAGPSRRLSAFPTGTTPATSLLAPSPLFGRVTTRTASDSSASDSSASDSSARRKTVRTAPAFAGRFPTVPPRGPARASVPDMARAVSYTSPGRPSQTRTPARPRPLELFPSYLPTTSVQSVGLVGGRPGLPGVHPATPVIAPALTTPLSVARLTTSFRSSSDQPRALLSGSTNGRTGGRAGGLTSVVRTPIPLIRATQSEADGAVSLAPTPIRRLHGPVRATAPMSLAPEARVAMAGTSVAVRRAADAATIGLPSGLRVQRALVPQSGRASAPALTPPITFSSGPVPRLPGPASTARRTLDSAYGETVNNRRDRQNDGLRHQGAQQRPTPLRARRASAPNQEIAFPIITRTGPAGTRPTGPKLTGRGLTGPSLTGPSLTGPSLTGPSLTGPSLTGPGQTGRGLTGLSAMSPGAMGARLTWPPTTVAPPIVNLQRSSTTAPADSRGGGQPQPPARAMAHLYARSATNGTKLGRPQSPEPRPHAGPHRSAGLQRGVTSPTRPPNATASYVTPSYPSPRPPATAAPARTRSTLAMSIAGQLATARPTTARPTTAQPATAQLATARPTTAQPANAQLATARPTTAQPATAQLATARPTTAQLAIARSAATMGTNTGERQPFGTAGLPVLPIAGAAFALGRRQASAQPIPSSAQGAAGRSGPGGGPSAAPTISARPNTLGRSATGSSTSATSSTSTSAAAALAGFAMTTKGAMSPMRATPSRSQVSRFSTSGIPSGLPLPSAGGDEGGADGQPYPPTHYRIPEDAQRAEPTTEQSNGPKLSEQLDMLTELFAERRQADLERRGLFLHPEVF
jgi:hypothetical protein